MRPALPGPARGGGGKGWRRRGSPDHDRRRDAGGRDLRMEGVPTSGVLQLREKSSPIEIRIAHLPK